MAVETAPARTSAMNATTLVAVSTVIGFVLVFGFVTAVSLAIGEDLAPSLGVAAFVAVWGGAGFGFMVGATQAVMRGEGTAGP